jgi:hypothetical protein
MWILFLILVTSPGHFEVSVLETYKTETAEIVCKAEAERIHGVFKKTYPSSTDKDTYSFICLKQREKEA